MRQYLLKSFIMATFLSFGVIIGFVLGYIEFNENDVFICEAPEIGRCIDPVSDLGADTPQIRLFVNYFMPESEFCDKWKIDKYR